MEQKNVSFEKKCQSDKKDVELSGNLKVTDLHDNLKVTNLPE